MSELTQWTRIDMLGEHLANLPSDVLNRILFAVKRVWAATRIQAATRGAKVRYNADPRFRAGRNPNYYTRSARARYYSMEADRDVTSYLTRELSRTSWYWTWGYSENRYDIALQALERVWNAE